MAENQAQLDSEIAAIQTQDATLQATLQGISTNILGQISNLQQKLSTGQDFTPEIASLTNIANDLGTMDTSAQSLQAQADAAANPVIANPIAATSPTASGSVASAGGVDVPPTSATAGAPPSAESASTPEGLATASTPPSSDVASTPSSSDISSTPPSSDTAGTPPSPSANENPEPSSTALTPGAAPENTPGMPIAPGSGDTPSGGTPNMVTPPSGVNQ